MLPFCSMLLKPLKNRKGSSPANNWKGWRYPNKDVDFVFNGEYRSLNDLVSHVRSFEKANELEHIEDIVDVLEDYFCRTCVFFNQFCVPVQKDSVLSQAIKKINTYYRGAKSIANIKKKALLNEELRTLSKSEINEQVDTCVGCSLNKFPQNFGHESAYLSDMEKAYGKTQEELDAIHGRADKLGKCEGCGCKLKTKVFLASEDYGQGVVEQSLVTLNNMLHAKTGNGNMCWQIKNTFRDEHLEEVKKDRKFTKTKLEKWGYR